MNINTNYSITIPTIKNPQASSTRIPMPRKERSSGKNLRPERISYRNLREIFSNIEEKKDEIAQNIELGNDAAALAGIEEVLSTLPSNEPAGRIFHNLLGSVGDQMKTIQKNLDDVSKNLQNLKKSQSSRATDEINIFHKELSRLVKRLNDCIIQMLRIMLQKEQESE